MTNDIIQQARDVLAKWRENSTAGPWTARADSPTMGGDEWTVRTADVPGMRMGIHEYQHGSTNLALIVGTAGNPDLLDAIDGMLEEAQRSGLGGWLGHFAVYFAAAIVAANERMSA